MNAFYRRFFRYGTEKDGKNVPRIALHLFRTHDEYLKLGKGPPVEWSGGQFTGDSVETAAGGGFDGMVGTLFHEAAHQFVSLSTTAAGWMNEGLASYFEGSRILANGTVITNLPANHRLFPLVQKMERGWMDSAIGRHLPRRPLEERPAQGRDLPHRARERVRVGTALVRARRGASSTSCGTARTRPTGASSTATRSAST